MQVLAMIDGGHVLFKPRALHFSCAEKKHKWIDGVTYSVHIAPAELQDCRKFVEVDCKRLSFLAIELDGFTPIDFQCFEIAMRQRRYKIRIFLPLHGLPFRDDEHYLHENCIIVYWRMNKITKANMPTKWTGSERYKWNVLFFLLLSSFSDVLKVEITLKHLHC